MKNKKNSMEQNIRWFPILFIAIGLLVLLIGITITIISYTKNQRFMETAYPAKGVISNINRYGDNHRVYVSFETEEGEEYEVPINFYSSDMYTGQPISIFYNPDNPRNISLGGFMGRFFIFFPMLVTGAIGLIFSVVGTILLKTMGKGSKNKKRLMKYGDCAMADIVDVTCALNISINGRSPYVLRCQYTHRDGQTYILKSEYLSYDPQNLMADNRVKFWYDPNDYTKYYVDVEGSLTRKIIEL